MSFITWRKRSASERKAEQEILRSLVDESDHRENIRIRKEGHNFHHAYPVLPSGTLVNIIDLDELGRIVNVGFTRLGMCYHIEVTQNIKIERPCWEVEKV